MDHVFYLLLVMLTVTEGMETRCEAPPVERGEEGAIICIFEKDISQEEYSFTVHKFDWKGNFEEVLGCRWESTNVPAGLKCETKPRYSYDKPSGSVTNFTVRIHDTTEEDTGSYVCQVIPSNPSELTPCNMTLKGKEAKERPSQGFFSSEVTVIAVTVLAVTAAVLVVIIFLIHRRRRNTRDDAAKNQADRALLTANKPDKSIPMSDTDENLRHADSDVEESAGSDQNLAGTAGSSPPNQSLEEFEACKTGDVQKLRDVCTLQKGSPLIKDSKDNSLLHVACRYDQVGVVTQLLKWGADMYARNDQFRTPLHVASYYGATSVIDVLLQNKMKIEDRDDNGYTALHIACEGRKKSEDTFGGTSKSNNMNGDSNNSDDMSNKTQVDVVLKLLHAGAFLRAVDAKGRTPLHLACLTGNEAVVKTLLAATTKDEGDALSAKCEVNVGDTSGQTPLHMACMAGSKEIVQILISYGADLTSKDKNGLTPELLAKKCGHKGIAQHLSKALKHEKKVGEGQKKS